MIGVASASRVVMTRGPLSLDDVLAALRSASSLQTSFTPERASTKGSATDAGTPTFVSAISAPLETSADLVSVSTAALLSFESFARAATTSAPALINPAVPAPTKAAPASGSWRVPAAIKPAAKLAFATLPAADDVVFAAASTCCAEGG